MDSGETAPGGSWKTKNMLLHLCFWFGALINVKLAVALQSCSLINVGQQVL